MIQVAWDGEQFECLQHKAKNNREPDDEIESVVQVFLDTVVEKLDKALVNEVQDKRRQMGLQVQATFEGPQADRAIAELGLDLPCSLNDLSIRQ